MFHVTSAQVESQTAHIGTQKTHLSPTDQDNHAKIAQQIAIPELVHSETPQVVVHSETSKKEDTQVVVLFSHSNCALPTCFILYFDTAALPCCFTV